MASDLIGRGTRDRRSDRWYGAIGDPFMSKGAKRRAGERKTARLEGKAEDLWDTARLEALTVYLGPVEKITAKGGRRPMSIILHPGRMVFGPQNTLI